jgi:hypothetical protein
MDTYKFLNIPDSCFIGSTIYKKVWLYCLKPETINIPAYKDEVRDYPEIEVIEVLLHKEYKLNRIAEIIMRTIPYPMLLIFKLEDKRKLYVAHQRISQSDSSKNTIEEFITTEWLDSDSDLFAKLDIKQMRFTNLYTLYSDIVDAISIYKLSTITQVVDNITGTEARELSAKIEEIEQKIMVLRSKLKKEIQFNRKMELNIEIKGLEQSKNKLLGGDTNERNKP